MGRNGGPRDHDPGMMQADSAVMTLQGEQRVDALRPGDLVWTADHGAQPIVRILRWDTPPGGGGAALRIGAGALAPGVPYRPLTVSAQQHIVLPDPQGPEDALVRAAQLRGIKGIQPVVAAGPIPHYALLLPRHEVIFANGCRVGSLLLTHHIASDVPATLWPGHLLPARVIRDAPAWSASEQSRADQRQIVGGGHSHL